MKEEYIYWKQQVGEKNAELESLRGDTSKQLASNSELELEIEGYKKRNDRLRQLRADRDLEKKEIIQRAEQFLNESESMRA